METRFIWDVSKAQYGLETSVGLKWRALICDIEKNLHPIFEITEGRSKEQPDSS
jgi:hypothetical protein